LARRSLLVSAGALLLYGAWAVFANRAHGGTVALRAGLTQGLVSFLTTLTLATLMEAVHKRLRPGAQAILGTVAAATALAAGFGIALHLAMGTPEILRSLAP